MRVNNTNQVNELIKEALNYKEKGDLINAEINLKKALVFDPNNFVALNNIGNIYSIKNNHEKAKTFFSKAIKIKPDYGNAIFNLALINEEMGNNEESVKLYKKAINCDPDNLGFYYNLSRIDKNFFKDNTVEIIKKILDDNKSTNFDKSSGFFILAEEQRKKINLKEEFNYLIEAHKYFYFSNEKINSQGSFYWIRFMPKIIKKFSFPVKKKTSKKIRPIFIMGLPRSGSTLIESILCSGKKIIPNGGETAIFNKTLLEINKKFFTNKVYLDDTKKLEVDENLFVQRVLDHYESINLLDKNKENIFTDKSLENFFFIEIIVKFFPDSKIIVCKRNIFQIILSIYQNFLPKIKWSHSIENILEYIDNYLKVIEDFKKKYPDKIYTIELEELTKNPLDLSKDLFNFCNLEWDKKCLEFYRRDDLVSKTASNLQVRGKIFINNRKKYTAYKEFFLPYLNKYEWLNEVL
jgi:tetratricopeptide (TPR) repeat protein